MNNRKQRVLIVDDNEDVREPLAEWLERAEGIVVQTTASGEDAVKLVREAKGEYDVILMDEVLPGIDGIETMRRIRADFPNIQVIMFTGVAPEAGVKALREGAYRYIMKPIDNDEIAILLRHISEIRQLERRLVEEGRLIEATRRIAEQVLSVPKEQLLQEIANVGRDLLDVPVCIIWELDRADGMLKVAAYAGEVDEEYRREVQIDSQSEATRLFLEKRRPLALPNVQDARLYVHSHKKKAKERNWVSLLTAPMITQNRIIGILDVYTHSKRKFESWERQLLATFAAQAALAIRQASLTRHLQKISRLSLAGDYEKLADYVAEAVSDLTGTSVSLWMMDEKEKALRIRASRGLRREYAENAVLSAEPGRSVTSIALSEGHPVYRRDVLDKTEKPPFYQVEEAISQGWRSFLSVPLLGPGGRPLGALSIYGTEPHDFSEAEQALLSTFANQAAIAFENVRLLDQAHVRHQSLEELVRIGETVTRETVAGLKPVLEKATENACKLTGADYAAIYPYDPDRKLFYDLENVVVHGLKEPRSRTEKPRELGLASIVRDIDELVIHNVDKGELGEVDFDQLEKRGIDRTRLLAFIREEKFIQEEGVKAFVALSLKAGPLENGQEQEAGVLYIDFCQSHHFTEEDLDLIRIFGHQVGSAIQAASLFDKGQRRIRDLEIVSDVARIISTKLDVQDLLQTIVSEVADKLKCTHCTLFLLQEESGERLLVPRVTFGVRSEVMTRRFKPGEGLAGWAFQHGESLVLADARNDPRYSQAREKQDQPRSMLVAPVKVGNQTIGVISADQDKYGWFGENSRRLVDALALHAGIAIERAIGLGLLQDIGKRIISAQEVDDILQQIVSGAIELTNTTSGVIYLIGEDDKSMVKSFQYPADFDHPKPRLDNEEGLTRQVVKTGKILIFPDISHDAQVNPVLQDRGIRSLIAVPLKLKEKVIGVLYLNDADYHEFTETEASFLSTLASQAATAIENARLFEQLEQTNRQLDRRVEELEVLTDMSRGAVSALGIDWILDLVYEQAGKIMDLSDAQVQIAFYDEARDEVTFPLAVEQDAGETIDVVRWSRREDQYRMEGEDEIVKQFRPRARGERFGLTEYVIHTKEPVLIVENFMQEAESRGIQVWPMFGLLDRPTHSWLGVPLIVQDRVIGIISIQSLETEHAFDQRHVELLTTVASQAAVAIENARLYSDLKQQLEEIRKLQALSLEIASKLDMDELLKAVAEVTTSVVGADFTTVFLYDQTERRFYAGYRMGTGMPQPSLPTEEGLAASIAWTGTEVIIENCRDDSRLKKEFVQAKKLASTVGLPIAYGGASVGVLFVNFQQPHRFSERELYVLRMIVNQAAVAIENARLYETMEQRIKERTRELEIANSRIAQREAIEVRGMIAADFVHRLNNLAGTLPIWVDLIAEELTQPELQIEEISDYLGKIRRDTVGLLRAAEQLNDPPTKQNFDVAFMLKSVVRQVRIQHRKSIEVVESIQPGLYKVFALPLSLITAISSVITNAVEAVMSMGGGTISISAANYLDEAGKKWVKIEIRDTGPGIPKESLNRIFTPFFSTKGVGRGYGLWRAKTIVEDLGGNVEIESEVGVGTSLFMQLPAV